MIGKYLALLDKAAEDRVLGLHMAPGNYHGMAGNRCLVGCAAGYDRAQYGDCLDERFINYAWMNGVRSDIGDIESRYDALCFRFGTERINEAIRSRILVSQLRRSLIAVRATAGV